MKFKIDKGYCIKIDSKELFKRYNNRTIEIIIKYSKQLKKNILSDNSIDVINMIIAKKFGIRKGLFCENDFIDEIKHEESRARKYRYKIMNVADIYADILRNYTY